MIGSMQLDKGKRILRDTESVGALIEYVREVLKFRGRDPQKHRAQERAMINRVLINHIYDLEEEEKRGYR